MVFGVVDKVSGPTCRSAGLLAGRVHLTGISGTLVGGDPWVPMYLNAQKGSAYKVRHDSLHAPEHAHGCMEQLIEATNTQHYYRSCPHSALYLV
jgi:hypothetical protein